MIGKALIFINTGFSRSRRIKGIGLAKSRLNI